MLEFIMQIKCMYKAGFNKEVNKIILPLDMYSKLCLELQNSDIKVIRKLYEVEIRFNNDNILIIETKE